MTNLVVELNLETVISFSEEDDAAMLAAAEHIKKNWFDFITKHRDDLFVKVFCEIEE
jgi:hypothetical protein